MARNAKLVNLGQDTGTLNIDTVVTGSFTGGPTLLMDNVEKFTLSAFVVLEAETNSLTMKAVWQVSADASTWRRLWAANEVGPTALGTGTAGDDAVVTAVVTPPSGIYGWKYARLAILSEGATGAATDTYRIAYNYERAAFT